MAIEGGCYCGTVRYEIEGEPVTGGQCHCRACQHFSGGAPNLFVLVDPEAFRYVSGEVTRFTRPGLDKPVTREFCATCGTQLVTRRPGLRQLVVKVGTFDDPSRYDGPNFAIFTNEMQPFHLIPEGVPAFEFLPER